mmetsp:Transcript_21875/g.52048  ORF Transcript_21875/g.52048 Transcript_21875/m.52048 type:complete len:286 (+) Transcript_21875:62-919(+)|eukprot:CAMPEP_0197189468 /NCGR_PEP_ID=MMETSP1423-20130617/19782_1 /TAXON_ID=476441 /ORGANISM="Pseudo-nitzschia heimii, Strain UNC1101" /LENGTH=285 /DNA_ID=CAMNT_0042641581 /DNA_START=44 /DNA_END=901 /DNA_ORIENTATION=-
MTIGGILKASLLILSFRAFQLDAWSLVSNRARKSAPTVLFAKDESPRKRRFAQARTQRNAYGSDSRIGSIHKERIKTAGRKGTKRFVDPCKVFVGNLSFDTDEKQLAKFILDTMGQSRMALHSHKVIRDWKSGKSKGYGFVEFTDPIYATVCMDVCNGKKLNGRPVRVSQGKKKDEVDQVFVEKKMKRRRSAEENVIGSALDESEDLELDEDGVAVFDKSDDEDLELDAILFGIELADDDEQDDGVFLERSSKYEEIDDENLNREQRRDTKRRRKKKKLPSKGFG